MTDTPLQTAYAFYKQEHTRWNQIAILYVGVIGSVVLSIQYLGKIVPAALVFYLASLFSLFWLGAIQSLRRSSYAWDMVIQELEGGQTKDGPFTAYQRLSWGFNHIDDLKTTFGLKKPTNPRQARISLLSAVTRTYQGVAVTLTLVFFGLGTFQLFSSVDAPSLQKQRLPTTLIERHLSLYYPGYSIRGSAPMMDSTASYVTLSLEDSTHRVVAVQLKIFSVLSPVDTISSHH